MHFFRFRQKEETWIEIRGARKKVGVDAVLALGILGRQTLTINHHFVDVSLDFFDAERHAMQEKTRKLLGVFTFEWQSVSLN